MGEPFIYKCFDCGCKIELGQELWEGNDGKARCVRCYRKWESEDRRNRGYLGRR